MSAKTTATTAPATTTETETDEQFMAPVRDMTSPEVQAVIDGPAKEDTPKEAEKEAPVKKTPARKPATRKTTTAKTTTTKTSTAKNETAPAAPVQMVWEEPPTMTTARKNKNQEMLDQLKANPGRSARVAEGKNFPNAATTWKKYGCTTTSKKMEDGTYTTWATWPVDAPTEG